MLAAAVVTFGAAVCELEELGPAAIQLRLVAAASLGLPLFTTLTLLTEDRRWPGARRAAGLAAGALALLLFYLAWPAWSEEMRGLRYTQLSVAFHLAVAFVPVLARSEVAFWQYNRRMFVRFLAAAVSSGTLYLGLALAIVAVHTLFDVPVDNNGYARLWFLIAFVFNTWFFLGGVPGDLAALEGERDYPQALRIFAQYTLVPLVSIYLVILTLYLARVLVTWDWPRGWIGWLVTGVSGAGILALLLVHPLAEREDQRWIRVFARDFWIAVMPAVVMLWLAIYQRMRQYGVTEPRYFLLVLSVWLGAMAMYYTVTRSRRIRVIPVSLCVLALVTLAGPWGPFAISARSQAGRLQAILTRHGTCRGGACPALTFADSREISRIVRYLVDRHDAQPLLPLLPDSLRGRVKNRETGEERVRLAVAALGAEYVTPWQTEREAGMPFNFAADERAPISLGGYDVLLRIRTAGSAPDTSLSAALGVDGASIDVRNGPDLVIAVPLDTLIARLPAVSRRAPSRQMARPQPAGMWFRTAAANDRARVEVWLSSLSGMEGRRGKRVTGATGFVLVSLRP